MKTLKTNKSNFFVKADGLFGFFNQDGKLLREGNAKEWGWAEEKMEPCNLDINFDIDSLRRIVSKRRSEAIKKLVTFSGLSEELVQNVLGYFKKSPEDLEISGQMKPDWQNAATCTGGCLYSHREWNTAWGISAKGVVSKIPERLIGLNAGSNANGSTSNSYGYSAEYLMKSESEATLFVINSGYCYQTDGRELEEADNWEIFKKPDLSETLAERRAEILRKVKEFFLDIPSVVVKEQSKLFDEIVTVVGINHPDEVIFDEMPTDWEVEAVSSNGCAYSDQKWCIAWAVNTDRSVVKIDSILMQEEAEQNANGHWSDSYGYTFKYLRKTAPKALFFVVNNGQDRWADRQPSVYSNSWSFLRPLSRKEIMIQKINSQNKVVTLGDIFKGI